MNAEQIFKELARPFPEEDVEWRIGRSGMKGDKIWATCLVYVTNRAIQDRLDDVVGPMNWKNEYREGPGGGVLCGLSLRIDGEWITKWDGAENTTFESVKGGLSGSMKRASVMFGLGRYLYGVPEGRAIISDSGKHYQPENKKTGVPVFKWDPPKLPVWALPALSASPASPASPQGKPKNDEEKSDSKSDQKKEPVQPPSTAEYPDDIKAFFKTKQWSMKAVKEFCQPYNWDWNAIREAQKTFDMN